VVEQAVMRFIRADELDHVVDRRAILHPPWES
jgi:hypothetical protein